MAEASLERQLTKDETVHHINGVRADNRSENLYVFPTKSAHRSYHVALKHGMAAPLVSNLPRYVVEIFQPAPAKEY